MAQATLVWLKYVIPLARAVLGGGRRQGCACKHACMHELFSSAVQASYICMHADALGAASAQVGQASPGWRAQPRHP